MGFFYWVFLWLIIFVIALFLLKRFLDCDLNLLWYYKFGKSPDRLSGKVVWILGATYGLGEALAYELAKKGCKLVISSMHGKKLNETKAICLSYGKLQKEDVLVLPIDMMVRSSQQSAVEKVVECFQKVDIVVNDLRGAFLLSERTSRPRQNINIFEPVSLMKAILPYMPSDGRFVIGTNVSDKFFVMADEGFRFKTVVDRDMKVVFENSGTKSQHKYIPVTIICSESLGSKVCGNVGTSYRRRELSPERITSLAAVGIANNLFEVWILDTPKVSYCYLFHYLPNVAKKIEKWL